jgi:hypothetical protein
VKLRRFLGLLSLLAGLCVTTVCAQLESAAPPGEETPEIRRLIDRAQAALAGGRTVSELLADESFMPAHAYPRFRGLIRQKAPTGTVTLASPSEPGQRMRVRGTVRGADGRPLPRALLYAYQTSAKGWYSDKAPHISGNSGDFLHARLFAYLRTDAAGRYELHTIRPAGYPGTDLPAHIHVEVEAAGDPSQTYATEIRFDDDPRLTPRWRERSRQEGALIVPVEREAGGAQSVVADFQVR